MAKDTPAPRNRTPVRIVNLKRTAAGTWQELTKDYDSSADAKAGQTGAGTYQVAHLFGKPETLSVIQPDPILVRVMADVDTNAQPAPEALAAKLRRMLPTAPEADDDES